MVYIVASKDDIKLYEDKGIVGFTTYDDAKKYANLEGNNSGIWTVHVDTDYAMRRLSEQKTNVWRARIAFSAADVLEAARKVDYHFLAKVLDKSSLAWYYETYGEEIVDSLVPLVPKYDEEHPDPRLGTFRELFLLVTAESYKEAEKKTKGVLQKAAEARVEEDLKEMADTILQELRRA